MRQSSEWWLDEALADGDGDDYEADDLVATDAGVGAGDDVVVVIDADAAAVVVVAAGGAAKEMGHVAYNCDVRRYVPADALQWDNVFHRTNVSPCCLCEISV